MQSVLNAVQIVLAILLMVGLGMLLYKVRWFTGDNLPLLTKLVVKVSLPAMIINNMFTQYTAEQLIGNAPGLLAAALSVLATVCLGLLAVRLLKLPRARAGVFVCMFAFSNSVFIGLPVSRALFGDSVTPYTLLYYFANTSMFWGIGYPLMRRCGGSADALTLKERIALHLPLPLSTFLACAVLVLAHFRPPQFVLSAAGYVGNLVTPLSLLYTGAIIMRMIQSGHVRWQRGYLLMGLGRFVVCPGLMLLFAGPFRLPELMTRVLVMQAAMPVMSQTSIVAATSGSDDEYAAGGTALTTALSLLFIPLYMYLLENIL